MAQADTVSTPGRWALLLAITALLTALPTVAAALGAELRVGDSGSVPDPARFDDAYPDMKEWAAAGVRGGIPARGELKVIQTLKPGDDIQAAIDKAGPAGGVVLLSAGTYPVERRLTLRDNVVLRGESREAAVLECRMTAAHSGDDAVTVWVGGARHAGLEDLTIQHQAVAKLGLAAYQEKVAGAVNDPKGATNLFVGGVQFQKAQDCWVDRCNIVHSGTRPLIAQGAYLTIRDTLIDGALNKGEGADPGGSGTASFPCDRGLIYNCAFKHLRHGMLMHGSLSGAPCRYNVILDCNVEGDIDFHGNRQDEGHNLFEGALAHAPRWHGWPAWSYWRRADIGPDNLVYKSIGWGGPGKDPFASTDPEKVYTYTGIRDPNDLPALDKAPPRAGTLYAVTGARPTRPDAYRPFPKTAAEASHLLEERMLKSPVK